MKQKLIFLIIVAALIGGVFSLFSYKKDDNSNRGILADNNLSIKEKGQLIKDSVEKYQPKGKTENTAGPTVSAKAAIVVDEETNKILYAKNVHNKLPPASIIKILTFSLALESFNENDLIEISPRASEQIPNKINMKPGEKIKLADLLYGLMMISANDAAYAIADAYPRGFDEFIELANKKIEMLGLKNTVMANPAGLDDKAQKSTAFDMATITRYTLLEHPEIIEYAGKNSQHSVYATEYNEPHWWNGHLSHMLSAYPSMIAAKTGYTDEAGTTYIGIAERNNRRLIVVILGAKGANANNDVKSLLDYGFSK